MVGPWPRIGLLGDHDDLAGNLHTVPFWLLWLRNVGASDHAVTGFDAASLIAGGRRALWAGRLRLASTLPRPRLGPHLTRSFSLDSFCLDAVFPACQRACPLPQALDGSCPYVCLLS